MIETLAAAADSMQGVLHGEDRKFRGINTDTRALHADELFFALQGPNFDGHDYVAAAATKAAAGAVVSRHQAIDTPQIVVDDVRRALGRFGAAWRDTYDVTVVGITGSNGKTTLKELIAACLSLEAPTLATKGNLNNDIGVPLMLARIEASHRYAVLEMGANHAGEIAYLTSLVNPDVVAITNAGPAHLEGFGSIKGVSRGKGEILQNAKRPRAAVLNADDDYFDYWKSLVPDVTLFSFGFAAAADVRAEDIEPTASQTRFRLCLPDDATVISLPLVGTHNVKNACAAAAVAHALGIGLPVIRQALESVGPVGGRLQPLEGRNGAILFDDSYNANPESVVAATQFLAALPGESWLVLGDMKELGDDAVRLHREVGDAARANGVDRLFALGDLGRHVVDGFGEHARWYASMDALVEDLDATLAPGINVLVKGSRSMRMEGVVSALRADAPLRKEA